MHEIVTLQFGGLANYVGTHFWNTQESYFTYNPADPPSIVDHDVNFRPGIGSDGSDTYTPRALIYDFKSGFGSLRKVNALYELDGEDKGTDVWHGGQKMQTAEPVEPSPYQVALESGLPTFQMQDDNIRYWSDYSRVYYHPRSLIQLSPQSLTSQLSAFESYSAGIELFRDLDQEFGGILDRDVRLFAEECDNMQGFQVFGSVDDAWGGFMTRYIQELEEDFGKKSVWVWSLTDSKRVDRNKQLSRLANSTQALVNCANHVSAIMRISTHPSMLPNYVQLESASMWNASALISSAVESVTLPLRLWPGPARGSNMALTENLLDDDGRRKLWNLTARARPQVNEDHSIAHDPTNNNGLMNSIAADDTRLSTDQRQYERDYSNSVVPPGSSGFDIDLQPKLPSPQVVFPSLQSSRGQPVRKAHIFALMESQRVPTNSQVFSPPTISQQERFRQLYNEETVVEIFQTPLAFPLLDSFPKSLFPSSSNDDTPSQERSSRLQASKKRNIYIDATLSTSTATKTELLTMRDIVVGRPGRAMRLVETEESEALYDDLTRMAEAYTFGYEDDYSDEGMLDE